MSFCLCSGILHGVGILLDCATDKGGNVFWDGSNLPKKHGHKWYHIVSYLHAIRMEMGNLFRLSLIGT
jgi:hypothetical protein